MSHLNPCSDCESVDVFNDVSDAGLTLDEICEKAIANIEWKSSKVTVSLWTEDGEATYPGYRRVRSNESLTFSGATAKIKFPECEDVADELIIGFKLHDVPVPDPDDWLMNMCVGRFVSEKLIRIYRPITVGYRIQPILNLDI